MTSLKQTQDKLQENNQKLTTMLTEMDQQQVRYILYMCINNAIGIILVRSRGKCTNSDNEDCRDGEHY